MTTNSLKTALRSAFPGVDFSVRFGKGSAYGNLYVRWTDGPSREDVWAVLATPNRDTILLVHEVSA